MARRQYVPALRFDVLTPLYDPFLAVTTRERTFKERLLAQADLRQGQRVLDLGCGTGTLAIWAAQRVPGLELVGVDGDESVLARARRKAASAGVRVELVRALASDLPFPAASFDRVLSSLFFHHVVPDAKAPTFAEIARVLAPGGQLHVADWGKPTNRALRALAWSVQLLDGIENTRDNIAGRVPDSLRAAGLRNVEVAGNVGTAFGTVALYRAEAS